MSLETVYVPVRREMEAVETLLGKVLKYIEDENLLAMNVHLLSSPGKRLRPALVLLTAKAAGIPETDEQALVHLGAAMELIHIASLVHDDVMDEALIRHNKPTINARWGGTPAIAYADYLFAESMRLLATVGNPKIVEKVSEAISLMSQGQVIQVFQRGNTAISEETYTDIITKKTGALFSASCAAPLQLRDTGYSETIDTFCHHFGLAFQITDDLLDLFATKEQLGKEPGQDILEGEYTLPIIRARERMDEEKQGALRSALERKDKQGTEEAKTLIKAHKGDKQAAREAANHLQKARDRLHKLPKSQARDSLEALLDMLADKLPCELVQKDI